MAEPLATGGVLHMVSPLYRLVASSKRLRSEPSQKAASNVLCHCWQLCNVSVRLFHCLARAFAVCMSNFALRIADLACCSGAERPDYAMLFSGFSQGLLILWCCVVAQEHERNAIQPFQHAANGLWDSLQVFSGKLRIMLMLCRPLSPLLCSKRWQMRKPYLPDSVCNAPVACLLSHLSTRTS